MTSSTEMGRRQEKSSFSLTCSRLSQYIKEKGCASDLGLSSAMSKQEGHRPPTTMSLLPGIDVSGDDCAIANGDSSARNSKEPEKKAQLTIFYGGKVLVFDNFPAEKAEDLMQLAGRGSGVAAAAQSFSFAPSMSTAADTRNCPAPTNPLASFPPRPQPNFSDLPIARKASLHRFLEKRKDRICAIAPYQLSSNDGMTSVKQEELRQPWLGLGPQSSKLGLTSEFRR